MANFLRAVDLVCDAHTRGVRESIERHHIEWLRGSARFVDAQRVAVSGAGGAREVSAPTIIVATGSRPSGLPGVELRHERVMDSTAALELPDVPERLLVIGGGYIGLEMGTVYATLGSRVTLVEMTAGLLPGLDRDLVQPLHRRVDRLFAALHLETKVTALREAGAQIEADLEGRGAQRFDRVLVAVGRRAQSDGIGLEATRARLTERTRFVQVDERCRTEDPRIYAVGDVTGEPMLAHRAMRQGKVAAEALAGRPAAFDNLAIPAVVFTDPEIAWCGLSESQAKDQGIEVKIAKFHWAASGRAATIGRADGLTKLVADAASGRVLGVGIVGPSAGELIAEATLAVETAALVEDVAATIHAHPTLSEGLMEAAEHLLGA
jgi:dihydrolipoamide dehydrogenase